MSKKPLRALPPLPGSEPAQFTVAQAIAIQAFANAKANEEQQRIAYRWIMEAACGLPVWAFRHDARETDIALGRQFVAQQIIGVTKVNISLIKQKEGLTNNG